ncbi:MAG: hypothetical protein V4510_10465 [bacterium]
MQSLGRVVGIVLLVPCLFQFVPVGAAQDYEPLTGATPAIRINLSNPVTQTFYYNWTTSASSISIDYKSNVTKGTVSVEIRSPEGTLAFARAIDASISANQTLPTKKPGTWTVSLALSGYQGLLLMKFKAGPAPIQQSNSASGPPSSSGTKASPADLLAAYVIIFAVMARRRKA